MRNAYSTVQKSRISALILGSLFFLGVCGWTSHKLYTKSYPPVTKQYLVQLRAEPEFKGNEVGISHFDKLIADKGATVEDLFPNENVGVMGRWIIVTGNEDLIWDLSCDYQDIENVEENQTVALIDGDTAFYATRDAASQDKTWGLRIPKIKEGLAALKATREVIVGVVDTGCDLGHPALKDRLVKGHNFAGGNEDDASNRNSDEMHATHVTGTIIAKLDSDGFYGIANSVAKVMNVRVLNESGSGTLINVSRGIVYAAEQGVNVINMSLGGPGYSRALHDSVKFAVNDKHVTVVCAKGNSNTDKAFYPAEFPEVIRVTATFLKTDGSEDRAYFSNYGKSSTCAAPGHIIYSTLPGGKYGFASGTSMACPHAAACAAVILSQGNFTPEEVKAIMETRGDELKTDQPIGLRINLYKYVQKAAHDLMPLFNDHPYGQCCADAGIVCRDSVIFENGVKTTIHEDRDGSTDTVYEDSKGVTIFHRNGADWTMNYTPISTENSASVEPINSSFEISDWCWKCADFHESNKVCEGVREWPTAETP